jgi:hypothetical protein
VPVNELIPVEFSIGDSLERGVIEGRALVEGWAANNQAGHEVIAAGQAGHTLAAITDPAGNFIIKEVPVDIYSLSIRRPGFLTATYMVDLSVQTNFKLETTTLPAGDINGDGVIDVADAAALGAAFGRPGPDEGTDLDGRDEVNVLDLILLAGNFGRADLERFSCSQ